MVDIRVCTYIDAYNLWYRHTDEAPKVSRVGIHTEVLKSFASARPALRLRQLVKLTANCPPHQLVDPVDAGPKGRGKARLFANGKLIWSRTSYYV